MCRRSAVACLFTCFLLAQKLLAQTGSWSTVAAEPLGTHIYIVAKRHHRACKLLRVTDNELLCEEGSALLGSRTLVVPRQEIRALREVHAREVKMAIGAVLGAAAVFGIGRATVKTKDIETRVGDTVGCALAGAIVGAVIGRISSEHRSNTIYKR